MTALHCEAQECSGFTRRARKSRSFASLRMTRHSERSEDPHWNATLSDVKILH